MEKRIYPTAIESVESPEAWPKTDFNNAREAVDALKALYVRNTKFLRDSFMSLSDTGFIDRAHRGNGQGGESEVTPREAAFGVWFQWHPRLLLKTPRPKPGRVRGEQV